MSGEYITEAIGSAIVTRLAVAAPAPAPLRHITEGAMKDRLGFGLVTAIAASTHPVCIGVREMLNNRDFIDLDRPDLRAMLSLMVDLSLPAPVAGLAGSGPLTVERAAEVIEGPVLDKERP